MTSSSNIIFSHLQLGPMGNIIYFIGDRETGQIGVVDPGWDMNAIEKEIKQVNGTLTAILLTHGHADHINGIEDLMSRHSVPVYLSKHEAAFFIPEGWTNLKATSDKDIIRVGKIEIQCLWSPGHSSGGTCFRCGDILLTGDTLFINAVGRSDFPGGDAALLYETLYQKIMPLPDSTMIYPGHAYGKKLHDTLANQKKTNPYLQCRNLEEFLQLVG